MSSINPKNVALSPAGADLGLGDSLTTQLDDQEEERRKRAIQNGLMGQPSSASAALLGGGSVFGG